MPRWFLLLAFPVVVGFACVTMTMAARELDPATQAQRAEAARHEAALNRIAEAEAAERARVLAPALALAGAIGAVGTTVTLVVLLAVYAYHRFQFVNVAGVSVSRQLALQGATLPAMNMTVLANGQARIEAARNPAPALPPGLRSYSPRYANRELPAPRQASPVTASPALPAPVEQRPALPAPTWDRIATSGLLSSRGDWLVGFDPSGKPVLSPGWDAWIHAAIAGLSRSGKTNTARLMLAQAASRGMRLAVFDPHATHPDGLGNGLDEWPALLAPVASTAAAMLELARQIDGWLNSGGNGGETLIVIDEWTRLFDGGVSPDVRDALARAAAGLVTSGAKFGLHLAVIGQGWTVDAATHVRDGLQMAYLHKLRPDQARLVTNSRPPATTDALPTGQAYLWHEGEWQRVGLPRITADDMRQVALLPQMVVQPSQPQPATDNSEVAEPAQPATVEERIRALAALGMNRSDISRQVFGHKDGGTMDSIRAVLGPVQE